MRRAIPGSATFAVRLGQWITAHAWPVVIAVALLAAVLGYGAKFLEFNTNYRVFFSEENPQLKAFEALEKTYTKTDNILFTLKPKQGDVFQPEVLALVQELTAASWKLPYAQRVDSITNFQHTRADEDELIVEDLVEGDPHALDAQALEKIRAAAMAEPLLVGQILAPDGQATGVNVTVNLERKDAYEVPHTVEKVRALVEQMREKYPAIEIRPSGMVFMNNAFMESSMRDMQALVPAMYGVLLVTMVLFLRSILATLATTFVIFFSAASAMGFGGWIGYPMTPSTSTVPTIVLTLAIADSIHILLSMLNAMRGGMARRDAIVESLRINLQPVFLTSLTTCIGFLALNSSEAPPFWHLGNMAAFGVMMAFFYSVTFLPALLTLLPITVKPAKEDRTHTMERFANFLIHYRLPVLLASMAVSVFLGAMVSRIELNDQFVQYFDHSIAFRGDTEFMIEHLTGVYNIDYNIAAGGPAQVSNPHYLTLIDHYARWLREQPEVRHVYSISDIFKRLNRNMHNDDDEWYRLPDDEALAGQYLLLYELSLPYGLDLNDRINIDKSAVRLSVWLDDMSTNEIRAFKEKSEQWLKDNAPEFMRAEGTSPVVMFAYISQRNIDSMTRGNILSLLLISLSILIALRSVKIGLFSLVPNIVPIFLGYGVWGLLIGEINMAVAICAAVSLGIIVDDSVHFLSKYLRARREKGLSSEGAVRYAFTMVGPALIVTTLILMAGFGMLATSAFQLNAYLGLLTLIVIGCALAADFLLLPTLLLTIDRDRGQGSRGTGKQGNGGSA